MFAGLKLTAIVGVAALAVGFGSGWSWRDSRCDAAAAKAQLAALEKRLKASNAAAEQDAKRAAAAEAEKSKIEGVARDIESRIGAGECLSADDADRLRDLWK